MDPAYLVGSGGALGAVLRYAVGQWASHDRFPFATLAVNVVGSFALALVAFGGVGGDVALFLGVGACGSFTTYSSFSFQTVRLWETGDQVQAITYAGLSLLLGLLAALLAVGLGTVV
ncbi:MAG: CrcB family protein [Halanaeroarchaeum sp.]